MKTEILAASIIIAAILVSSSISKSGRSRDWLMNRQVSELKRIATAMESKKTYRVRKEAIR